MGTSAYERYLARCVRHGAAITVLGAMIGLLAIAVVAPPLPSSGEPAAGWRLVHVL
ncbi:MAG: hypothetical protein ACOYLQ_11665 [Hyphomicrobiaceae bacterium]|jgi:hypothetical protein